VETNKKPASTDDPCKLLKEAVKCLRSKIRSNLSEAAVESKINIVLEEKRISEADNGGCNTTSKELMNYTGCNKPASEEELVLGVKSISKVNLGEELVVGTGTICKLVAKEKKNSETDNSRCKLTLENKPVSKKDVGCNLVAEEDLPVSQDDAILQKIALELNDDDDDDDDDDTDISFVLPRYVNIFDAEGRLILPPKIPKRDRNKRKIMNKNKNVTVKKKRIQRKKSKTQEIEEEDGIFRVEKILHHRDRGGRREYLIKWEGYDPKNSTWEPAENLIGCHELLEEYRERKVERICYSRERSGIQEYLINWVGSPLCHSTWEPLEHVKKLDPDLLDTFVKSQEKGHEKRKGRELHKQGQTVRTLNPTQTSCTSIQNKENEHQLNNGISTDTNNLVASKPGKQCDEDEKIVTQFGLLNDVISDLICPVCKNNTLMFRKKGKTRFVISSLELHCQKCDDDKKIQEEMKEIEAKRKQIELIEETKRKKMEEDEKNISKKFICDIKKEKLEKNMAKKRTAGEMLFDNMDTETVNYSYNGCIIDQKIKAERSECTPNT
ncbi:unnamed protein product, partial [Meganyctiphanes norvegica]